MFAKSVNRAKPAAREQKVIQKRWWTLAVLSLSLLIVGMDNTVLNVALPTLQAEFGASASTLQWIVDAYIVVFAGLLLTTGAIGDKFGRKKALQGGLVLIGAGSVYASFSGSATEIIISRAVIGIGAALAMPSTLSIIVNVFPERERTKAIAVWSSVAMLGIVVGPIVGGWLLEHAWWGSIFLLHGPIVGLALAAGWFLVPESRNGHATHIDIRSAILSIGALSMTVFAIIELPAKGPFNLWVIAPGITGLSMGFLFVARQLSIQNPLLDVRLFSNRQFTAGVAPIAILSLGVAGVGFLAQQYMQILRGYGPLESSIRLFLPIIIGNIVGASLSPRLEARFGTRATMAVGLVIAGAFYSAFIGLEADTSYWMLAAGIVGIAVGMGMASAPATSAVMSAVPGGHAGVGSAVNDATREIGTAMGIAVMGSIANWMFSNGMSEAVRNLPADVAHRAGDSILGALGAAQVLGGSTGQEVATAGRAAFMDALGLAFVVAGALIFLAAGLVWKYMPARRAGLEDVPAGHLEAAGPEPVTGIALAAEPTSAGAAAS